MRPTDIKRELERLTVDASMARTQLSQLRSRLSEARTIVESIRESIGAALRGAEAPKPSDGTPEQASTQGVAAGDA